MEQIKILEIINRWGYLNTEQIALLLNKEVGTVDKINRFLIDKKLIRVDQLTRKNIYMLSSLGNRKLGKKSKSIRINYNELVHQDSLIKWLCKQTESQIFQQITAQQDIKNIFLYQFFCKKSKRTFISNSWTLSIHKANSSVK